jgi:hypothetical protein
VKTKLRFRQVHLDFHTSEAFEDVGAEFNPQEFTNVFSEAHVDSVTFLRAVTMGGSIQKERCSTFQG